MSDVVVAALADYALAPVSSLDDDVDLTVRSRILDTVGCALRAHHTDEVAAVRRMVCAESASPGGARIWGTPTATSVEPAAFANTAAIRSLDLNDSYFGQSGLHPSDMWGGILTYADFTGRTLGVAAEAGAVGYEIAIELADVLPVTDFGWDHVVVLGIGAVCGLARVASLTPDQLVSALAIYVTSHVPTRQSRAGKLAHWKCLAAAHAVGYAVRACLLARAGIVGPDQPFVGKFGFLNQLLASRVSAGEVVDAIRSLTQPRRVLDAHLKIWPFGYVAQSAVWAAQRLRDRVPSLDLIAEIEIVTFAKSVEFMASSVEKWQPMTRETADHSLPYVVLEMLRRGTVDEDSFTEARFATAANHKDLGKVKVRVDDAFTSRYPQEFPSQVTVRTKDGRHQSVEVAVSPGHRSLRLPEERLVEKYLKGAGQVLGTSAAEGLAQTILHGPASLDVRSALAPLAVTGGANAAG